MPDSVKTMTAEASRLSVNLTPDPAELQRRIDGDAMLAELEERATALRARAAVHYAETMKRTVPLREEVARLSNERSRILGQMKSLDARIRTIRESALKHNTKNQELILTKRKISGRKRAIKARYIKQLLCLQRQKLTKALAQPPVLGTPVA